MGGRLAGTPVGYSGSTHAQQGPRSVDRSERAQRNVLALCIRGATTDQRMRSLTTQTYGCSHPLGVFDRYVAGGNVLPSSLIFQHINQCGSCALQLSFLISSSKGFGFMHAPGHFAAATQSATKASRFPCCQCTPAPERIIRRKFRVSCNTLGNENIGGFDVA